MIITKEQIERMTQLLDELYLKLDVPKDAKKAAPHQVVKIMGISCFLQGAQILLPFGNTKVVLEVIDIFRETIVEIEKLGIDFKNEQEKKVEDSRNN